MKYIIQLDNKYLSKFATQQMIKSGNPDAFTADKKQAKVWDSAWLAHDQLEAIKMYGVFPGAWRRQVGDD